MKKFILFLLLLPNILAAVGSGSQSSPIAKFDEEIGNGLGVVTRQGMVFEIDISRDKIPNAVAVHKFGKASDIDSVNGFVDIWDAGDLDISLKIKTYSTTADIDSISSSDAGDTQTIFVIGLDVNWIITGQFVTLDGQNRVALTTALIRVFRMRNDSSTSIDGIVYCYVNGAITNGVPDVMTTVRAIINDGNNRTLMTHFTIPEGMFGLWHDYEVSLGNRTAVSSNWRIWTRPFEKVFSIRKNGTLNATGTSSIYRPIQFPIRLEPRTDIVIRADTDVTNNISVSGELGILLYTEEGVGVTPEVRSLLIGE